MGSELRQYSTGFTVCLRARFRAFPETGSWAVKQMVRRTGSKFSEKGKNPKLFKLLTFLFPRIVVVSLCSLLLYFDRRFVRHFLVGQRFQCLTSVELSLFRLQSVLGKSTEVGFLLCSFNENTGSERFK